MILVEASGFKTQICIFSLLVEVHLQSHAPKTHETLNANASLLKHTNQSIF